ncbi:MAG: NAD-dependent malic enzyme [Nitrospinota bacterium]|nr:NAD-dependent malic enzyme [Nitrospinota bacterium]
MRHFEKITDENGAECFSVKLYGADLLHNPTLNKGTAYPENERSQLGLVGLLPPHVSTMEEQIRRVYENYSSRLDNMEKYVYLRSLQDRNETLFYAVLKRYAEEMTPIIYTPTVGEAVRRGSHIYRLSRGLYVSPENVEIMDTMAANLDSDDIRVIVVTDNQGILGIGDQGVGGMGIPIGKLSLYTLGAGIAPWWCLPICLDVGTDNEALLDDPLYLGAKHRRLEGMEYDKFIDKFVNKIQDMYPKVLLQWEDFSKQNAYTNLDRYRDKLLSFNDDIQGTGAVVLAGIIVAMRITEERIADQKFLIYGAGAGGVGIARQIKNALMEEGLDEKEAFSRILTVDRHGAVTRDRPDIECYKVEFAADPEVCAGWVVKDKSRTTLLETVENWGATVLLGTSGQPGAFNREVVEAMTRNSHSPLIFPLSNPTSKAEAKPADILEWSDGRAIVATGSPFDDVMFNGKTRRIGQGNNVFIFPGVGLGALASGAGKVTDEMFTAAARRLADMAPQDCAATMSLYPSMAKLGKVSEQVALAVYNTAVRQGLATAHKEGDDPLTRIKSIMWKPEYMPYVSGAKKG